MNSNALNGVLQDESRGLIVRSPKRTDGKDVSDLIRRCPPLDENSAYCNLLQCEHFASTSAIALDGEKVLGFVSGYRIPAQPDTIFIWQVAVDSEARGLGLGVKMLEFVLAQNQSLGVKMLETTITKSNAASWGLFRKLAKKLEASIEDKVFFDEETHFSGAHPTEYLVSIGPFNVNKLKQVA